MDVKEARTGLDDIAYEFWSVLANVSEGDWTKQTEEWQEAARRVRDRWHAHIREGLGDE